MPDPDLSLVTERLQQGGISYCVATIVDGRGSIPQIVGARAVFTRDGLAGGTVGGGTLETTCAGRAIELLAPESREKNQFVRWNLQRDLAMTCGGEVSVYFEVVRRDLDWNIALFGAGHVAQVLCRFLGELDCRVTCVDTRAEWLARLPQNAKLDICLVAEYRDGVERIIPGSDVVIMTMGHRFDVPILVEIARRNLAIRTLGLMGSDAKALAVRRDLEAQGVARDFIDRILCPIGEKIGNNTPAEISVAVVSQLLRLRHAAGGSAA